MRVRERTAQLALTEAQEALERARAEQVSPPPLPNLSPQNGFPPRKFTTSPPQNGFLLMKSTTQTLYYY